MKTDVKEIADNNENTVKSAKTKAEHMFEFAKERANAALERSKAQVERMVERAIANEAKSVAFKAAEEEAKVKAKRTLTEKAIEKREKRALKRKGLFETKPKARNKEVDMSAILKGTPITGKSLKRVALIAKDTDENLQQAKLDRIIKKASARKMEKDLAKIKREKQLLSAGSRLTARAEFRREKKRKHHADFIAAKTEKATKLATMYAEAPITHTIVVKRLHDDGSIHEYLVQPVKAYESATRVARLLHMNDMSTGKVRDRNRYFGTFIFDKDDTCVQQLSNPVYRSVGLCVGKTRKQTNTNDKIEIHISPSQMEGLGLRPKEKVRKSYAKHVAPLSEGMEAYLKKTAEKRALSESVQHIPNRIGKRKYSSVNSRVRRSLAYAELMEKRKLQKIKTLPLVDTNVKQAA